MKSYINQLSTKKLSHDEPVHDIRIRTPNGVYIRMYCRRFSPRTRKKFIPWTPTCTEGNDADWPEDRRYIFFRWGTCGIFHINIKKNRTELSQALRKHIDRIQSHPYCLLLKTTKREEYLTDSCNWFLLTAARPTIVLKIDWSEVYSGNCRSGRLRFPHSFHTKAHLRICNWKKGSLKLINFTAQLQ